MECSRLSHKWTKIICSVKYILKLVWTEEDGGWLHSENNKNTE